MHKVCRFVDKTLLTQINNLETLRPTVNIQITSFHHKLNNSNLQSDYFQPDPSPKNHLQNLILPRPPYTSPLRNPHGNPKSAPGNAHILRPRIRARAGLNGNFSNYRPRRSGNAPLAKKTAAGIRARTHTHAHRRAGTRASPGVNVREVGGTEATLTEPSGEPLEVHYIDYRAARGERPAQGRDLWEYSWGRL